MTYKRIILTCQWCRKPFEAIKKHTKYCSENCRKYASNSRLKAEREAHRAKNHIRKDDGHQINRIDAIFDEHAQHYSLRQTEVIEQSRISTNQPHVPVRINNRTWVLAKPGADTEAVKQHVTDVFTNEKVAF